MSKHISMREIALKLFVIMIVSFSIAGSMFSRNGGLNSLNIPTYAHKIDESLPFCVDGITTININCDSPTVKVIPIDGSEVLVHFYGYVNSSSEDRYPKLNAEIRNNNLVVTVIQVPQTFGINLSRERQDLQLEVHVPKTYSSALSVTTSSGNATIEGFSLDQLTTQTTSGDVYVKSIQARNCQLHTSSGDMFGEAINADQFRSEASSGKIELGNLLSKDSVLKTSSGNISSNSMTGNLRADSSSGDISIDYMKFENNIDISNSSGNVEIRLPNDTEFLLSVNSSSGLINNAFPLKTSGDNNHNHLVGTVGNGGNKLNVNTASGDINIRN